MQKLRTKLRSEQGASILFALFFFIVCAVIGSIVLTAATAAAGRLSRVKEMDERYYAVNSAAQVLEKEINDTVVTGRKWTAKKNETALTVTNADNVKDLFKGVDVELLGQMKYLGKSSTDSNVMDVDEHPLSGMKALFTKMVADGTTQTKTYSLDDSGIENVAVTVQIEMLEEPDATNRSMPEKSLLVTITGTSTRTDEDGDTPYILTMKFPSHTDKRSYYQEKTEGAAPGGTTTVYRLTTETETITWSVASVMKGATS